MHLKLIGCFMIGMMTATEILDAGQISSVDSEMSLMEAQVYLADQDYEKAEKVTRQILEKSRGNEAAEKFMAQVIQAQGRHTNSGLTLKPLEEMSSEEKRLEIERWMERTRSFLALGHYEEAVAAVEKVFLYQSYHPQASRLLDEIHEKALQEGHKDLAALEQAAQEEIKMRIKNYRRQAKQRLSQGQWGHARVAIDKILMLDPSDREALRLKEGLKQHEDIE